MFELEKKSEKKTNYSVLICRHLTDGGLCGAEEEMNSNGDTGDPRVS